MRSILKSRLGRVSAVAAIAAAGVLAATAADARPWHYHHHGYYNSGPAFALGAFAGAVTGAAVASSYYHPYYYAPPPPAYYYPPPAYRYGYNYNLLRQTVLRAGTDLRTGLPVKVETLRPRDAPHLRRVFFVTGGASANMAENRPHNSRQCLNSAEMNRGGASVLNDVSGGTKPMRLTRLFGAALGTSFLFLAASSGAMAYDHWGSRSLAARARIATPMSATSTGATTRPVVVHERPVCRRARAPIFVAPQPMYMAPRCSRARPAST